MSAAGVGPSTSSRSTIGMANASVLPEPVGLLASTSPPRSASGIAIAWISNGVSMPRAISTLHTASETPSARKVWVMSSTPSVSRDPVTDEGNVTSPESRITLRENHGSTLAGRLPDGAARSYCVLAIAIDDATALEVVRRELDPDPVARVDADAEPAHLAGRVAEGLVAVVERNPELAVPQRLDDLPFELDLLFLDSDGVSFRV